MPSVTLICVSPTPRRTQLSIFTVIDVLPIFSMSQKQVTSSPTMTGR